MRSRLACLLAACVSALAATPAIAFSGEGEAALVSDYRWRGVSLSDEQPSLQLQATGAFENGMWLWGAFNTVDESYGGEELGLGAGYDGERAGFEWCIGLAGYIYPDADDLDYVEVDASVVRPLGPLSLSVGLDYMPAQDNVDDDNTYVWAGADLKLGQFNVHGHVGRDDGLIDAGRTSFDYSLGAGIAAGRLSADLSFVEAESDDSAWVARLAYGFSSD